jgi:hypothetical protein
MIRILFIVLLMGMTLGPSALSSDAYAQDCGKRPCRGNGPEFIDRDSFVGRRFLPPGIGKQRRRERRRIESIEPDDPSYYSEDVYVQSDGEGGGGRLIGPTEALTQALAAVPGGKALDVKLLRGPNPVYAVKLRFRGQVRRILVDARTAQVVGE